MADTKATWRQSRKNMLVRAKDGSVWMLQALEKKEDGTPHVLMISRGRNIWVDISYDDEITIVDPDDVPGSEEGELATLGGKWHFGPVDDWNAMEFTSHLYIVHGVWTTDIKAKGKALLTELQEAHTSNHALQAIGRTESVPHTHRERTKE